MRGRKPPGPEFVERLEGEAATKQRLRVILQTLSGELGFAEAAAVLGLTPQRLHVLRQEALQAAVTALTPQPPGRPRQAAAGAPQVAALQAENERLRHELEASRLREEIALLLSGRRRPGEKKRRRGSTSRARRRGAASRGRRAARGVVRGDPDAHPEQRDRPGGGGAASAARPGSPGRGGR